MSRYQKICIGVGLIAFIAIGVYAPWISHTGVGYREQEFRFNASLLSSPDGDGITQIDVSVLLVRWLVVIAITIALVFLFSGVTDVSARTGRWFARCRDFIRTAVLPSTARKRRLRLLLILILVAAVGTLVVWGHRPVRDGSGTLVVSEADLDKVGQWTVVQEVAPPANVASVNGVVSEPTPPPPGFTGGGTKRPSRTPAQVPGSTDRVLENAKGTERPETGMDLIPATGEPGHGALTVANGTSQDAVLKLASADGSIRRFVYVRAHDTLRLLGIGQRACTVQFALGSGWDIQRLRFQRNTSFAEFADGFAFQEARTSDGVEYAAFRITLHPVLNGNARTRPIDAAHFYGQLTPQS